MAGAEVILLRSTSNSAFSLVLPVFDCHSFFYRNAGLFSIASATNIHGSKFDQRQNPIAVQGTLDSSITPANMSTLSTTWMQPSCLDSVSTMVFFFPWHSFPFSF
jgi:hypothetical protein